MRGKSTVENTSVVTVKDEEKFWEAWALGTKTPEQLLHTVFNTAGKENKLLLLIPAVNDDKNLFSCISQTAPSISNLPTLGLLC